MSAPRLFAALQCIAIAVRVALAATGPTTVYDCLLNVNEHSPSAWYDGSSFDDVLWQDQSGNGHHATVNGTLHYFDGDNASDPLYLNGQPWLFGGVNTTVTFPTVVTARHTVFNLCKYNGDVKRKILQGSTTNSWFGHYANQSGVAFEGNEWLTLARDRFGEDWVLSAQQSGWYRANGIDFTVNSVDRQRTVSIGRLQINAGFVEGESSDFACSEVLIFNDQLLEKDEIGCIENYFNEKYDLGLSVYEQQRPPPFASCLSDGHSATAWYDSSSYLPEFYFWNEKVNDGAIENLNVAVSSDMGYFAGSDISDSALYLNHHPVLHGAKSVRATFPTYIEGRHTFFHVAKHKDSGAALFSGGGLGFFGFKDVYSGVAKEGILITELVDRFGTDWVISAQQAGLYRGNGVDFTLDSVQRNRTYTIGTIDLGGWSMSGSFAIAELIIFNDQILNDSEIICIERQLADKYAISIVAPPTVERTTRSPTPLPTNDPTVLPTALPTALPTLTNYSITVKSNELNMTQIEHLVKEIVFSLLNITDMTGGGSGGGAHGSVNLSDAYQPRLVVNEDESVTVRLSVVSDVQLESDVIESTLRERAVEEYGVSEVEVDVETSVGDDDDDHDDDAAPFDPESFGDDLSLSFLFNLFIALGVLMIVSLVCLVLCVVSQQWYWRRRFRMLEQLFNMSQFQSPGAAPRSVDGVAARGSFPGAGEDANRNLEMTTPIACLPPLPPPQVAGGNNAGHHHQKSNTEELFVHIVETTTGRG